MRDNLKRNRSCMASALLLLPVGVAACSDPPAARLPAPENEVAAEKTVPPHAPLPLRVPISAIMTGTISISSYRIFQGATVVERLSDDDWLRIGADAVELVGAATLITVPGTGSQDAAWVSNPAWTEQSAAMQSAAMAVGGAAAKRDREALGQSTARLAQSCQSCHMIFSPRLVTSAPEAH